MTPDEQQRILSERVSIVMTRGELVNTIAFLRNSNLGKMNEDADTVATMYVHVRNLLEAATPYVEPQQSEASTAQASADAEAVLPENVTPITGEKSATPPGTPSE